MPFNRSHFDGAAQEGLVRALIHAALAGESSRPYVVITTAPSQWLPYCSADEVTILDVTGLVGPTSWWSEADARDRALAKFQSLGWPDSALLLEQNLMMDREAGPVTLRADLVLADRNNSPVAVVEIKRSARALEDDLLQVQQLGNAFGVAHAFLTDGDRIFVSNPEDAKAVMECHFPTPEELGVDISGGTGEHVAANSTRATVMRCHSVQALLEALDQLPNVPVISDYTLPLYMYDSLARSRFLHALPKHLETAKVREVSAMVVAVVAAHSTGRRVVAVLPPNIAQSPEYAGLRKYLSEGLGLAGVIHLPPLSVVFDTSVAQIIVVLGDYPINTSKQTVFITLANRGDVVEPDTAIWWATLRDGLQGKRISSGFSAPMPVELPWTGVEKQQEAQATLEQLRKISDTVPLGDLCDLFLGADHPSSLESRAGVGVPVVRGRDLSSPEITKEQVQWFALDGPVLEKAKIKQGDVLIQRIGASPHSLVVGVELEGSVASNTVFVARPKDPRANPTMICHFLRSNAGQRLLAANFQGTGAPTLSLSMLRRMPIPLMTPDIFHDLDELELVESELRSRADKLEALRLGLYGAESRQDLTRRLRDHRLFAATLRGTLKQAETLAFQVYNVYPFPLAYSYRLIGSRIGTDSLYQIQLRVAENVLAFLGSLTLALLEPDDHMAVIDPNPRHAGKAPLQSYWEAGISPGHWRDLCRRGAAVLTTYQDNALAVALGKLWAKGSAFPDSIDKLVTAKNDYKHDRGPDDEKALEQASSTIQGRLDAVMLNLSFLTRFPISLIRDLDAPRGTRTVVLRTLDYIGDHPEHPSGQYEYSEPLPKNDLYIQVRPDLWVPLYPFLTVRSCPQCKTRETYFIDTWLVSDHKARLKSFERGHPENNEDVATAFSQW